MRKRGKENLARIISKNIEEVIQILKTMGYEVNEKMENDLVLINTRENDESSEPDSYPPHHGVKDARMRGRRGFYESEKIDEEETDDELRDHTLPCWD